jgi:hypothetical protein
VKKILIAFVMAIAFASSQAFAHHAAEGTVSDELYDLIEDLLEGTPHEDMTLEDLDLGMTEMTFTVTSMAAVNELIEFADDLNNVLEVSYKAIQNETVFIVTITTRGTSFIYNRDEGEWIEKRYQNQEND